MIIRADLLTETFKSGRAWNKLFWALKENNFKLPSKVIIHN
jgi:hypothetical protein